MHYDAYAFLKHFNLVLSQVSMKMFLLDSFLNATTNPKLYQCCSGFCIDLLRLLSEKISFDFELFEVPDKKWGAFEMVICASLYNKNE